MLISTIRKIKNTRKVIKFTFITGILLTIWSIYYLIIPNCFNQSYIIGTSGIALLLHGAYILRKGKVAQWYMVYSYNITSCILFISWAIFAALNNVVSGIIMFLVLSVIGALGAYCIKKYGKD